jgi:hypothetical protein
LRKLNTEPSIGASHQVSGHLAKQLQRRRFLEIDQSETRMACGGHVYFFSHTILFMGEKITNLPQVTDKLVLSTSHHELDFNSQ